MIPMIISGLALLLIVAAIIGLVSHRGRQATVWLANNSQIVNISPKGRTTKLAGPDYAFTQRYLVAARDLDDGEQYIMPCGAGNVPYGIVDDMTPTTDSEPSDYPLPVDLLGMCEDTKRAIAAGAISNDHLVYSSGDGQVSDLTTAAAGTYWVVGKCLWGTANGAGDQIELLPCFPYQVTIAA